MKNYAFYVYILASQKNGTLYIGVTNSLTRRIFQHKHGLADGFTKKHNVTNLVYHERFENILNAISREKELKRWMRHKKLELIESKNPEWNDLYDPMIGSILYH